MNAKQKEKIQSLIKNDAKLRHQYCDENGNTCVIGCLLLNAGVDLEQLKSANELPIKFLTDMLDVLSKQYGIDRFMAIDLQKANDLECNVESRRLRLLQMIDGYTPYLPTAALPHEQ